MDALLDVQILISCPLSDPSSDSHRQVTETLLEQKQRLLDDHGASVSKGSDTALKVKSRLPHFIRISDIDIEIIALKEGLTLCGKAGAEPPQDVFLVGEDVDKEHAIISFELQRDEVEGCLVEVVTMYASPHPSPSPSFPFYP